MQRLLLIALLFCATAARAKDIALFVLAGQSNMQGWQGNAAQYPPDPKGLDKQIPFYWVTPGHSSSQGNWTFLKPQGGRFPQGHFGPEVTFARRLAESGTPVAMFKYSLGATSLHGDWRKPGEHGLYDQMVAELKTAVVLLQKQGHRVSIKALVWIQGESDAQTKELAAGFGPRLKLLIDDFRKQAAKDPALPIILGVDEQHPWVKQFPAVVDAQLKLAKDGRNIIATSMIGLEKADVTHLTPKGLEEHGQRLFDAYRQLTVQGAGR